MKKTVFPSFFILFFSFALPSNAQLVRDLQYLYNPSYFYNPYNSYTDTTQFTPYNNGIKKGEFKYHLEAGTGFSTFMGGLSSSFVSPMVSYRATDKLFVTAGGTFSYNNLLQTSFSPIPTSQGNILQQSSNPTEVFAIAHYQVNEKLSLFGVGAFGKNQPFYSPYGGMNSVNYNNVSLGMDYKVSNNFSFGASFGINRGPNLGWGNTPFGGFGHQMYNPFFP